MKSDVVVVGGGPVGLMTALGLARRGVEVALFEAEYDIHYTPRAIAYAWTIFAGLEYFGLLEDMLAEGMIVDTRSWRRFSNDDTITYNHDAVKEITNRPFSLTLGQDIIGQILVRHLALYDNVRVYWGHKFVDLEQHPEHVTVTLETASGKVRHDAAWVVGADGGRSQVRKNLGLKLEGWTWPERFVATDIYYDFDEFGWDSGYLVDPEFGAVVYKLSKDNLWRVTYAESRVLPVESVAERIPAFMQAILPGKKTYDLVLFSPYNMHQRTAPNYRVGRVLLAGDSAHVTNPTSGFGLMGGMNDVFTLCDPLAAVIKGDVDDSILDDYARLRRKVYNEVTTPVSSESKRLVFNSSDPERLDWDFAQLKARQQDPEAMRKFLMVPAALETPSLLTGQSLAELCKESKTNK
ncbi:MAG: FAD-dependent oxidoreductase [Porticoccaceae bacterium]